MSENNKSSIELAIERLQRIVHRSKGVLWTLFMILIISVVGKTMGLDRENDDPKLVVITLVPLVIVIVCFIYFGIHTVGEISAFITFDSKLVSKLIGFENTVKQMTSYKICLQVNLFLFFLSPVIMWFTIYYYIGVYKLYNKISEIFSHGRYGDVSRHED